jgi:hypothetical protein
MKTLSPPRDEVPVSRNKDEEGLVRGHVVSTGDVTGRDHVCGHITQTNERGNNIVALGDCTVHVYPPPPPPDDRVYREALDALRQLVEEKERTIQALLKRCEDYEKALTGGPPPRD